MIPELGRHTVQKNKYFLSQFAGSESQIKFPKTRKYYNLNSGLFLRWIKTSGIFNT